mgnify:CR=1 FL=1
MNELNYTCISIHAPPRGATLEGRVAAGATGFQFTPLREGRPALAQRQRISETYFNSRPSARGDGNSGGWLHVETEFQFTPLREGRPALSEKSGISKPFQFTPLREGRQLCASQGNVHEHFNSRPSARGDVLRAHSGCKAAFQFTPLREGRLGSTRRASSAHSFQFTPLREGRHSCTLCASTFGAISIHAPPRGATTAELIDEVLEKFQFTPLREGRRWQRCQRQTRR